MTEEDGGLIPLLPPLVGRKEEDNEAGSVLSPRGSQGN